ncbi:unnamed protein product [Ixodes pacificus]
MFWCSDPRSEPFPGFPRRPSCPTLVSSTTRTSCRTRPRTCVAREPASWRPSACWQRGWTASTSLRTGRWGGP